MACTAVLPPSRLFLALDKALSEVHAIQRILSQDRQTTSYKDAGYEIISEALRISSAQSAVACQTDDDDVATIRPDPHHSKLRSIVTQSIDQDDFVQLRAVSHHATASPSTESEVDQSSDQGPIDAVLLDGTGRLFSNFCNDLFLDDDTTGVEPEEPLSSEGATEPGIEWGSFLSGSTPLSAPPVPHYSEADSCPSSKFSRDQDADIGEVKVRMPFRSLTEALNNCCQPIPSVSPIKSKPVKAGLELKSVKRLGSCDLASVKDNKVGPTTVGPTSARTLGKWRGSLDGTPTANTAASKLPASTFGMKENSSGPKNGPQVTRSAFGRQSLPSAPGLASRGPSAHLSSLAKPVPSLTSSIRSVSAKGVKPVQSSTSTLTNAKAATKKASI